MEWSPQQDAAIKKASLWAKRKGGTQVHKIFGYAGTGKTTLAKEIENEVSGTVLYGAFTGKAASVMRKKGCNAASTLHSMIYRIKDEKAEIPEFELNPDSDVSRAKLVVVDEVSMVDELLGKDLLSFDTKILVLGDPAQLPPIRGTGFFTEGTPDTMLTEVHRQARDNPIIRMSMLIREGGNLEPGIYGESRVVARADLRPEELSKYVVDADQVIVGLNRTRSSYNSRLRELLGRCGKPEGMPVKDDKLVCLKNDRKAKVLNGTIWYVNKARMTKDNVIELQLRPEDAGQGFTRDVRVRREFFLGTEAGVPWEQRKGQQEFTFGYALTCHKSQGSQWDNIVVFDEGASFREDAIRWRYTAVTRAAEKLLMVV